ncbi:MAG: hypothetical protein PHX93_05795 [Candidatus Peribacteraceae bacterium]|nr:hypothetical protein [Candidatus Peribacteraceae bacterium]
MTTIAPKVALTAEIIDRIDANLLRAQEGADQADIGGTICFQIKEARNRLYGSLCLGSNDLVRMQGIKHSLSFFFYDNMEQLTEAFLTLGGLRAHPHPPLSIENAECTVTSQCLYIVHELERNHATGGSELHLVEELFSIVSRHLQSAKAMQRMSEYSAKLKQLSVSADR